MTDDNSKLVDMDDDLDTFSDAFFNRKPVTTDEPEDVVEDEVEEEVVENEDDALATDEDTDADEDEPSEDDEPEDEPEPEEEPKPKGKKSFQDRINELTAKARNEERRAADLEKRLAELEARKPEEIKSEAKRSADDDAPTPDALDENGDPVYPLGEFDPKFILDLVKFTNAKERQAAKEEAELEAQQKQIKAQQDELVSSWASKVDEAEKELPDLREKLAETEAAFEGIDPDYGEYLASTIMTCDFGPQIMYYLSQNIGEAQKIVASGPAAATLAIGRLDAKFTKAPAEKRNTKVSAAPKPPESRVRGSGTKASIAADTDDLDAFERVFFNKK